MAIHVQHPKEEFVDTRGGITFVVEGGKLLFRSALRITGKKGAIRSNHYHEKDLHALYVEKGRVEYAEKPVDEPHADIETVMLGPGDVVVSKPRIIHAVRFLEDGVLWAFTTEQRDQAAYEKDTKRITILK